MIRAAGVTVLVLLFCSVAGAAGPPVAVSPGSASGMARIGSSCPTFNWGSVVGAGRYDLVVYAVGEAEGMGESGAPVLSVSLPGSVSGWTPSLDQCLTAGGRYAWAVRAVGEGNGAQEAEWSAPSLFEVPEVPSAAEVEEALAVLRRYRRHQETGGSAEAGSTAGEVAAVEVASAAKEPSARSPEGKVGERSSNRPKLQEPLGGVEGVLGSRVGRPGGLTGEPAGGQAAQAPILSTTPSLTVDDQIHLGATSDIFKDGEVFLWSGTTGNTALGRSALASNEGSFNTASGAFALFSNTTGKSNTASGAYALDSNTTGSSNTASGTSALYFNTTGYSNTASGAYALLNNTTGDSNTANGKDTLRSNTTGDNNTASGAYALSSNTTGFSNTASGTSALYSNTTGSTNTASGRNALNSNTTGYSNTASGAFALDSNTTGSRNTASGTSALYSNSTGKYNTASGINALNSNTTGDRNTALGNDAGRKATTGDDNIFLGSGAEGVFGEGHTIRIGGTTVGTGEEQQNRTFINGIRGVTVANSTAVLIDANTGQLGTVSSSRRYKEDIRDMAGTSDRLLALRPVTFRYKQEFAGGEKPVQFGLIAEEVAEVFPELVVYDEEGEPETVQYHLLSSLLLNELQKQLHLNREQARWIEAQTLASEQQARELRELSVLKERLAELEDVKARKEIAAAMNGAWSLPACGRVASPGQALVKQ